MSLKMPLYLLLMASGFCSFADIMVKNDETIAFLGDSITQFGNAPDGYLHLIMDGLKRSGVNANMIPAGVSGNKSNQMLGRLDQDVISKKPDWMLLSCGVNDVGHGAKGVSLEDFKKNINTILDKLQAAGIKVMILTPTLWERNVSPGSENNQKLEGYCEFLRKTATERKLPLADINLKMKKMIEKEKSKDVKNLKLTIDNLHMNGHGNQMMSAVVLEAFGIPSADIERYKKEWNKIPCMAPILNNFNAPAYKLNIDDYEILRAEAEQKNMRVDELVKKIVSDHIEAQRKNKK